MNKLIATIGVPASGKSVWALREKIANSIEVVERDMLRKQYYDQGEKWSKELEKKVTDQQSRLIAAYLNSGKDVIVSDTNINSKTRQRLKSLVRNCGAHYEEKLFRIDLETAKKRNKNREGWKVVQIMSWITCILLLLNSSHNNMSQIRPSLLLMFSIWMVV